MNGSLKGFEIYLLIRDSLAYAQIQIKVFGHKTIKKILG